MSRDKLEFEYRFIIDIDKTLGSELTKYGSKCECSLHYIQGKEQLYTLIAMAMLLWSPNQQSKKGHRPLMTEDGKHDRIAPPSKQPVLDVIAAYVIPASTVMSV